MANLFGGADCAADAMGNCLSVPNLTPDATGLKDRTDQQILDAFRLGKDPDAVAGMPGYLFANMPYYRFANLSDDDARAIVAYLRSIPAVMHEVKENAGTFATQPAVPQWTPADPTKLPPPGAAAPADASNGKYLATIMCSTCHTVNTAATAPLHIDETKAFQGGKATTPMGANMMMFQSANLTPDKTGLQGWTQAQIVTAITMAQDKDGKTLCAPMAANPVITPEDAKSIADYLLSLTPVANSVTACKTRM
jgi:mono/diheme cytochrome c family protein